MSDTPIKQYILDKYFERRLSHLNEDEKEQFLYYIDDKTTMQIISELGDFADFTKEEVNQFLLGKGFEIIADHNSLKWRIYNIR